MNTAAFRENRETRFKNYRQYFTWWQVSTSAASRCIVHKNCFCHFIKKKLVAFIFSVIIFHSYVQTAKWKREHPTFLITWLSQKYAPDARYQGFMSTYIIYGKCNFMQSFTLKTSWSFKIFNNNFKF